jgi:ADP-ribosylglycohydrolase
LEERLEVNETLFRWNVKKEFYEYRCEDWEADNLKQKNNNITKKQVKNSSLGFVLGDCLGVPYEFKSPGSFQFKPFAGYGTHHQPPGTWSDDTALTLAMLDAIVNGEYDEPTHRNNLKRFLTGDYFPDGDCFDVGNATRSSISGGFAVPTDNSFGNGGLLRIWTLAALSLQKEWTADKEREIMRQANALTHSTQELYMSCCELYFGLLQSLYRGESDDERYRLLYLQLSRRADFRRYQSYQGHICNAIKNVMDTFFKFPKYTDVMEPMCDVIEKGYDTDSNAALLGALLGAKQPIPEKYVKKIRAGGRIEEVFEKYINQLKK